MCEVNSIKNKIKIKTASTSNVNFINNNNNETNQNVLCCSSSSASNNESASSFNFQHNKSNSLDNLSFINIVGLPYHPRQTSVPSSSSNNNRNLQEGSNSGGGTIFNHFRNVSEPRQRSIINERLLNNSNNSSDIGIIQNTNQCDIINTQWNRNNKTGTTSTQQQQQNISNVNVNFHRTVPTTLISSVPTIECNSGKNVSNVQIMPLNGGGIDQNSTITNEQITVQSSETMSSPSSNRSLVPLRTFTSTEAQTDDCTELNDKERRRRERRERRQNRRINPVRSEISTQTSNGTNIPDLLDTHLPPPYTTIQRPHHQHQILRNLPSTVPSSVPPLVPPRRTNIIPNNNSIQHVTYPPPNIIPGPVPVVPTNLIHQNEHGNNGFRFALPVGQFRREHFSEEAPKGCCGVLTWKPGSLKWFIASIALVAIGCVLVGTALGTMRPAGRDHLTIALLMIGIGIVLVTISGVAWRLASQNTTSCRTMLGIGSLESVDVCTRRFVPRLPPTYGRPHHPYAAMMYPEFQYRPPPPTYQASMQEYRLRLLLIDRGNTPQIQQSTQNAIAPPPTYRSHNGSLLRDPLRNDTTWSEYSCPPSYRSQTYSTRLGTIQDTVSIHTRDPSNISEPNNENQIEILSETNQENTNQFKLILEEVQGTDNLNKEENLVTIVQTDDSNPVIVTVSGNTSSHNNNSNKISSEIQILAHL